eukprot:TRINITY_DN10285_c0_g1_i1.p1 TRINITY_DN10285_c0_g1~~TRINITY_DN10285_c0_g1_i1.p1  ORF type:complete len:319 (-),score=45.86 TRINITY_DN10285_c0_g1_i1:52-1008(-)
MQAGSGWIIPRLWLVRSTPSRRDGVSGPEECRMLISIYETIRHVAQQLRLIEVTARTATVFVHRFAVVYSLKGMDLDLLACTALFLAAKVDTCPRKLDDVLFRIFRTQSVHSPTNREAHRTKVVVLERKLLTALAFELTVEDPMALLPTVLATLDLVDDVLQNLLARARRLVNDLYFSALHLCYSARQICDAIAYMSLKQLELPLSLDEEKQFLSKLGTPGGPVVVVAICRLFKDFCEAYDIQSEARKYVASMEHLLLKRPRAERPPYSPISADTSPAAPSQDTLSPVAHEAEYTAPKKARSSPVLPAESAVAVVAAR